MSTPNNKLETELSRLGQAIERHRILIKPEPSLRAWCKQWPGLGSDKTWRNILKGNFESMNLEAQIPKYRGVLAALEAETVERSSDELYPELAPAQAVTLAALRLLHHHGKDRLILVEGGSGSSKTSSLTLLKQNEAAGSMILLEASDVTWRSPRAAVKDILRALGVGEDKIPAGTAEMVDELITVLKRKGRIILAIDEAHHLTASLLNLIKTLLNRTEALIILAGMKTLFQKLRAVASEEAKQLIHNRLFARIELGGPDADGADVFLRRRLSQDAADADLPAWKATTVKALVSFSRDAGHWAYLRRVVDQLQDMGIEPAYIDDAALMNAAESALLEIS